MRRYWLVLWVLGQYNLVLLGIKWYWVSIGLLCLYILKKGDLVGCYHSGTTNKRRTRNDRATQLMDHGRLRWAISKTSGICAFLFARQQWKVLRHNPLKSFFFSNHQRWQSFTLVILIGPSWDVNLSRDPFLVECTAAFSASSLTSFIRFPPSCHFLESSMSTLQFLFLILEPSKSRSSPSRAWSTSDVGTTQCSRDSTKMDFLTASSDISTLLATSSSSAASIGDQDTWKDFLESKIHCCENKWLCPVRKWNRKKF